MLRSDELIERLESLARGGAPLPAVIEAAVRGVHELSPRFHWTGIYELDADGVLRLGPYVGAPTEHVAIPVGTGVCGTAVAEGRDLNVPDVRTLDNYLACSLETRSELVVLIRSGERIHAQMDIDSHEPAAFDEGTMAEVRRVADCLARAYDAHRAAARER
jgi:GAF domain-containing protein